MQPGMNADCIWQPQQGPWDTWVQPSKGFMQLPCDVMNGFQAEADPTPRSSTPSSSDQEQSRRVPSNARAAKRQRGRERRKMFRAIAHETKAVEAEREDSTCSTEAVESERETQVLDSDTLAAAVLSHLKLVVSQRLFEACDSKQNYNPEGVFGCHNSVGSDLPAPVELAAVVV